MAHNGIFHKIEGNEIVVKNVEVTTGLWSGDTGSLVTFETSNTQLGKNNSKYFLNVYKDDPDSDSTAEVQFSLAYGHVSGAGSPTLAQDDASTLATKAVYFQFKNALLDNPEDSVFAFSGSANSDDIYAISIARSRFKSIVDPGNWMLKLSGSNGVFTFIDDSNQTLGLRADGVRTGNRFGVVSGSISSANGTVIHSSVDSNSEGYGWFYPQKGIIILNPSAIINTVGFTARATGGPGDVTVGQENTGSATAFTTIADTIAPLEPFTGSLVGNGGNYYDQYNWHGLYRSMVLGADFQARSAEYVSSEHFFIRVASDQANDSNNPTWIDETTGTPSIEEFQYDPKTFITTVGLYNDSNELVAVAKLSRPLEKSQTKEALIRVRLDF